MALPILDGNQTATTLSTVLTSGEHIPAHTVVSLGSTAISNITSAVSGSVVSVSNFPSTQTIAGTVTANLSSSNLNSVTIGIRGTVTVGNSVTIGSIPAISGTVTANVFGSRDSGQQLYPLPVNSQGEDSGSTAIPIGWDFGGTFQKAGDAFPLPIAVSEFSALNLNDGNDRLAVSIVNDNGAITGSNPLLISGTVTAVNVDLFSISSAFKTNNQEAPDTGVQISWWDDDADESRLVRPSQPLPISGTVTANLAGQNPGTFLPEPILTNGAGSIKASLANDSITQICNDDGNAFNALNPLPILGTVTANVSAVGNAGEAVPEGTILIGFEMGGTLERVSDLVPLPVTAVGTVTVGAMPSGSLTTRFGSVVTANLAQISSAVTNATRKYLLIQNVTTSSNVITIGIGFTPTTTQGIQLTAGAGITFESSYIPTGAVYVLSSVTASPFTIIEAG